MTETIIKCSVFKLTHSLLGSLLFMGGGFYIFFSDGIRSKVIGAVPIIFFGFCSIIFIIQLFKTKKILTINEKGFTIHQFDYSVLWEHIINIEVKYFSHKLAGKQVWLCVEVTDEAKPPPTSEKLNKFSDIVGKLIDFSDDEWDSFDIGTEISDSKVKPQKILEIMTAYLEHYRSSQVQ